MRKPMCLYKILTEEVRIISNIAHDPVENVMILLHWPIVQNRNVSVRFLLRTYQLQAGPLTAQNQFNCFEIISIVELSRTNAFL